MALPHGAATWRWRWLSLALALLAWGVLVGYLRAFRNEAPPEALRQMMRTLWALFSWWAINAACGWAQQLAPQREAPVLRALLGISSPARASQCRANVSDAWVGGGRRRASGAAIASRP